MMPTLCLKSIAFSLLAPLAVFTASSFGGTDDASRYSSSNTGTSRWMGNAHRGDIEFGNWEHEAVPNAGSAGRFIGSSKEGAGDIDTGGQSFGIYANPALAPAPYASSTRKFAKPALTTGDIFSFKLAVNNRSPGNRGFDLRSTAGTTLFNFDVRSGGYYVNGDNGASLNASHHVNTVFTFTFTQRERRVDYLIERSGGITASLSGSFVADSGSLASVKFYISGTGTGPASNLYFNQFSLSTETRGDLPLTLGERRMPGKNPSYILRFYDPNANTVTMRHGGDGFTASSVLSKDGEGVWSIDIRNVTSSSSGPPLAPGWHEFKFRLDSVYEPGANRWMYLDAQGRISHPPAVYLTWKNDPTTTMTASWYNHSPDENILLYRLAGVEQWSAKTSTTIPFPHTERQIHSTEITGLSPDTTYEFKVSGYEEVFKFRTMPSSLSPSRPVKFGIGGDVDTGSVADAMTAAVSSKNPDFLVVGGDHAYENASPEYFWKWYRYMESWFQNARSPDNRMIPIVAGIGNHEVRNGFASNHPDFDDSSSWRDRYATYYYRTFAFPGAEKPYGVLDFGNYLSLIITDTEHSSSVISGSDPQTLWLSSVLSSRKNVPNLIPVHHVPSYTSYRSFNDPVSQRIRQHWVPLYENAGVQLVFENHDHTFKRTKPLLSGAENPRGIRYLGDGLWGISPRPPDLTRSYLETASTQHHVHLVTLTASDRKIEAVDPAGNFFSTEIIQYPDGLPPSVNPTVSNLNSSSITLSWDSVPSASHYKIVRNDGDEQVVTSPNYTDSSWSSSSGYSYRVEALNRAGQGSPAVSAPTHRQIWNVNNSLPWDGSGTGANLEDPDGDGVFNLAEYFHGTDPRNSEPTRPVVMGGVSNGKLSMMYKKSPSSQGVSAYFVRSETLKPGSWTPAIGTYTEMTGDSQGWVLFQGDLGESSQKEFYQLKIE